MGTAQYPNEMSEVTPIENEAKLDAFKLLHEKAEKIHVGEMSEIERFKSIMDKLMSIEKDMALIKKHFNIVHIVGE